MAASELSVEQIHLFLLEKGGIVPNRDVVRHFRRYLTDPTSQDDARTKFKRYVNTLATTKTEGNEKFLILRPKFSANIDDVSQYCLSPSPQLDPRNAVGIPVSPSISIPEFSPANSPALRQPPPYRPPPPVTPTSSLDTISMSSSSVSINDQDGPVVPPRRRISLKHSESDSGIEEKVPKLKEESNGDSAENDKLSISVKERTQKFNRMASIEDDPSPARQQKEKKKKDQLDKGADEDDGAAVMLLDPKRRAEWYVTAAKGDYHRLVKLASEEPRFVKLKDQFTGYTVLHWGAKHGNEDIIKHFAGTYKCDVNAKTNGGYTPLHIAAQFGREPVYELLKRSYGADANLRDYSGRKPIQYKESQKQATATVIHKKARKKIAEKDLGFLRIGSLNVRVKKTTEAFSNFLGVGTTVPINPIDTSNFHKGWGSADNVAQENILKSKRKIKRPIEGTGTNSTPGTPNNYPRALMQRNAQDSDSDTAAGFDSHWQN